MLEVAYKHAIQFRNIYEEKSKEIAETRIKDWIIKTPELKIKEFTTVTYTISQNMNQILNFFNNRSTNAAAESFNAKIKDFRRAFRGVADLSFFMFRLTKIYA